MPALGAVELRESRAYDVDTAGDTPFARFLLAHGGDLSVSGHKSCYKPPTTRFGMRTRVRRIAAIAAPVGVAVSVFGILSVAVLVPFDPVTQAISELGDPSAPYSSVFNASFLVAGIVAMPFAVLLSVEGRNAYEKAGAVLVAASFVALSAIGAFPIGHPYHVPAAFSHYAVFTFALWVHGTGETLTGDKRRGLVAVWLGNANILVWATWAFWRTYAPGLAIPEALGAATYISWILLTARRLYTYNSEA